MENSQFIGRETEIALFRKSLEAIMPENQGKPEYENTPRILSFYGEKGVGKTSLLEKFWEIAISFDIKLETYQILSKNLHFLNYNIENEIVIPNSTLETLEKELNNLFETTKFGLIILDDFQNFGATWSYFSRYYRTTAFHDLNVLWIFFSNSEDELIHKSATYLYHQQELQPFTFEESKLFLNGFFSQFSDHYLRKIYDYTKGKPEQLQFLVDLIKDKKISAEAVLNELIRNEGKVISNFKELLAEKQGIQKNQKDVQMDVLAAMTYNLNHQFEYLQNDFANLKTLIGKTTRTEKENEKLDQILVRFQQNLSDAVNTFDNAHKVIVKEKIEPQKTNLFQFFEQEKQQFAETTISIGIISVKPNLEAEIDQEVFKDLIKNLVVNAQKHAFSKEMKNQKIVFEISETQDINPNAELVPFAKIVYKDNGKGFPENFDFLEYQKLASKAGNNKGSGIGGYWINKIIGLHYGKFRMGKPDSTFKLQFEILIPLKYTTY